VKIEKLADQKVESGPSLPSDDNCSATCTYISINKLWSVRPEQTEILEDINFMVDLDLLDDRMRHTEDATLGSTVPGSESFMKV
jgi:hypothetical protein